MLYVFTVLRNDFARDVERAEHEITALRDLRRRLLDVIPELKDSIFDYETNPETIDSLSNMVYRRILYAIPCLLRNYISSTTSQSVHAETT